jgi:hypothetical protein
MIRQSTNDQYMINPRISGRATRLAAEGTGTGREVVLSEWRVPVMMSEGQVMRIVRPTERGIFNCSLGWY